MNGYNAQRYERHFRVTCPGCGQRLDGAFGRVAMCEHTATAMDELLMMVPSVAVDSIVCNRCGELEYELRHAAGELLPAIVVTGIRRPMELFGRTPGEVVEIGRRPYVYDGAGWCDVAVIPDDWGPRVPTGADWLVIADRWEECGNESYKRAARQYAELGLLTEQARGLLNDGVRRYQRGT